MNGNIIKFSTLITLKTQPFYHRNNITISVCTCAMVSLIQCYNSNTKSGTHHGEKSIPLVKYNKNLTHLLEIVKQKGTIRYRIWYVPSKYRVCSIFRQKFFPV